MSLASALHWEVGGSPELGPRTRRVSESLHLGTVVLPQVWTSLNSMLSEAEGPTDLFWFESRHPSTCGGRVPSTRQLLDQTKSQEQLCMKKEES